MRLPVFVLFLIFLISSVSSANQTQDFLHKYRHSWLPYPLPYETTLDKVKQVCDLGMDTVGITFAAPYNQGNIDFSKVDAALNIVGEHEQRMVLMMTPRFTAEDNVSDRLSNGQVLTNLYDRNPNYSMIDVFDKAQRAKFNDYISLCVKRYGKDKRVAAFIIGWGYQGENGFYIGDWISESSQIGTLSAGYSDNALIEFNKWRVKHKYPILSALPMPSAARQSDDYILFMRFRCEFLRNVFQYEHIAAAKANTKLPVGNFAYISASPDNYARNWIDTPNSDFFRSAASCATFDMNRTLLDSGIGWEDSGLHDGKWDFTSACMQRDEARQIAKGAVFHAMAAMAYNTEPQWEKGLFPKVVDFLKTQQLYQKIKPVKPTIALYQPMWGMAAIPSRSEKNIFLPNYGYSIYINKMIGLAESFGLPYKIITEADLMDSGRLKSYRHIIIPMWDFIPRIISNDNYAKLRADKRVIGIKSKESPLTRTEFRDILNKVGIIPALDFDSDKILAGRTNNMIYNWDVNPIHVRIPGKNNITLKAHEYVIEQD